MITVNADEQEGNLSALLAAVENQQEVVVICRNGKPVAELRGLATEKTEVRNPLQTYPELAPILLCDPMEPATEDEWPSEPPRSVREFFGRFSSGDPQGSDNERIDTDLAREAAGRP